MLTTWHFQHSLPYKVLWLKPGRRAAIARGARLPTFHYGCYIVSLTLRESCSINLKMYLTEILHSLFTNLVDSFLCSNKFMTFETLALKCTFNKFICCKHKYISSDIIFCQVDIEVFVEYRPQTRQLATIIEQTKESYISLNKQCQYNCRGMNIQQ